MKQSIGFWQGVTDRWPASAVRLSALLTLTLVGCGSPLISGWHRDPAPVATAQQLCLSQDKTWSAAGTCDDKQDSATIAEQKKAFKTKADCDANGGAWSSVTSTCGDFDNITTAADCAALPASEAHVWDPGSSKCLAKDVAECERDASKFYDSTQTPPTCVARPTLTLVGQAEQTVEAGSSIVPLTIAVSPGATVQFVAQNCPNSNFFSTSGKTVVSLPVDPSWTQPDCTADVVSMLKSVPSQPVHLTVHLDAGFLGICKKLLTSDAGQLDAEHTVQVLEAAVQATDCTDANTKLQGQATLDLRNDSLVDLSPLASLTKLQYLYLEGNKVASYVPLAHLPALTLLVTGTNAPAAGSATCPTDPTVNAAVRNFCLRGDFGDDAEPSNQAPVATPSPVPSPTPLVHPPTFPTAL